MSDKSLKSAYELAMERLAAEDEKAGRAPSRPLTDEQKQEIAQLRKECEAKLAEREIMHSKHVAEVQGDPAKLQELEQNLAIDRERAENALDAAIERVKNG
ncbi:MAG: hypothetical protein GY716_25045 [bacterium]|nr:hypothetical protein [bacterium]